jgi:Domain of unknown function DUF29
MPSQLRVKDADGTVRGESLYDRDFAQWIEQQVELLRSGHTTALDVPNLVEELEGLTKSDERALGSELKRIMAHMLKQRYQPQRASRSRVDSIENGREEIADILEQSPQPASNFAKSCDRELPAGRGAGEPRYTVAARDLSHRVTVFTRGGAREWCAHRSVTPSAAPTDPRAGCGSRPPICQQSCGGSTSSIAYT